MDSNLPASDGSKGRLRRATQVFTEFLTELSQPPNKTIRKVDKVASSSSTPTAAKAVSATGKRNRSAIGHSNLKPPLQDKSQQQKQQQHDDDMQQAMAAVKKKKQYSSYSLTTSRRC